MAFKEIPGAASNNLFPSSSNITGSHQLGDNDLCEQPRNHQAVCANPECKSKVGLRAAPLFVCAYFGLPTERQKPRGVCRTCFQEAENHQSVLVDMLREHKTIILGPKKKPRMNMVAIDDEEFEEKIISEASQEVIVEGEITELVNEAMEKYCFQNQVEETIKHLDRRWTDCKVKMSELDTLHSTLEKNLDFFRKELYAAYEPEIQHLEPIEIDVQGQVSRHIPGTSSALPGPQTAITQSIPEKLPPIGPFVHSPVQINQTVYAMKSSLLDPWEKGRVVKMKESPEKLYVVRFDTGGKLRTIPLKFLAYSEPAAVQLPVGSRVIAQYVEVKDGRPKSYSYYAGVVAESPKYLNQYRYLIFFDDGYAQVIMVCHSSRDVWHDIHTNSRAFVSNYLKQFPERAMVKLQRGQTVKTELNGRWFQGRVEAVDASLAYIHFLSENRHEWIYRGSTRLYPLFELLANAEARKSQGATRPTHNMALVCKKKNTPYVEYTRGDVDPEPTLSPAVANTVAALTISLPAAQSAVPEQNVVRAVARKSTSKANIPSATAAPSPLSSAPSYHIVRSDEAHKSAEHSGEIRRRLNVDYNDALIFEPHQCSNVCVEDFIYVEGGFKNQNPLSVPMLLGWSREVTKQYPGGRESLRIVYRAPCGRRMRSMDELHRYLRLTACQLSVDLFCYDAHVHCFAEFEPKIVLSHIKDITYGVENVPVSCVNSIDRSNPEYVAYSTQRTPREGVHLNLDPNFLVCCDCTDDCADKAKCACWQMTLEGTSAASGKINQHAGYQYRRLMENVPTGVYECNSKCSCRNTCLNRVAQRPLQLRLQLFRTEKRGWGIRCLDDIPKGEFICVYAGQLLTDQEANDDGKQLGDEYLAELDLIETIEQAKDGYESDVDIDIDQPSDSSQASHSDAESDASSSIHSERSKISHRNKPENAVLLKAKTTEVLSVPTPSAKPPKERTEVPPKKTRELYGPNERCYVMDAKGTGNIGRYLNHSCTPNVFVQNVFVDTQDLRFPWVAFFAHCFIRAGTELTWDYSYQVGSVPEKTLYCYCGAKECRGRLL